MLTINRVLIVYDIEGIKKDVVLTSERPHFDFFKLVEEDALSGKRMKLIFQSDKSILLDKVELIYSLDYNATKSVFANGFQSWSESKLYKKTDKIKPLRKLTQSIMKPYGDYTYYDYTGKEGVIHSWTYTYLPIANKKIFFIGSLDEKNAFTNFVHHTSSDELHVIKDVQGWQVSGEQHLADLFFTENSERGAFQHYFMLCGYDEPSAEPAIGWTSWYHYYTKISEKIALENLENYKKDSLPIKIFQIDDGYQTRVGDWLSVNEKFPSGMKFMADEIKKAGFQAGIWLAPLAAEKKSQLFQEHPDWILKNSDGSFCKIGINPLWSMAFYALDIYHEEVRTYIKKVFQTVCRDWGFDLVKLDFLYGACLVPRNGRSRAGVMSDAMQLLREAVGNDKLILGCGVPLGSGMGTTDYCRIGADVHLTWDIKSLKWCNNRERASTLLAVTNTINRRQLNGYAFINDPDVLMLRKKKQFLNQKEQYTLLLANLIFGDLIFTSDNIADYDEPTRKLYFSIFPLVKRKEIIVEHANGLYKIFFQVDDRRYLALINLSEKDRLYKLPTGIYFDSHLQEIISNEQTLLIKKHESTLMHCCSTGPFGVIGSKGHFFAGSEITKISLQGTDIKVKIRQGLLSDPTIYLKIPKDYTGTTINGKPFQLVKKKDFSIAYIQLNREEIE
ncbi:MAG: alpha-galactosidase [Chitinophagales bacterium]|nr:alpha-galactosidase [Chitinophagales bacterium]